MPSSFSARKGMRRGALRPLCVLANIELLSFVLEFRYVVATLRDARACINAVKVLSVDFREGTTAAGVLTLHFRVLSTIDTLLA